MFDEVSMFFRTALLTTALVAACSTSALAQFSPTMPGSKHVQIQFTSTLGVALSTHSIWINGVPTITDATGLLTIPSDQRLIITDLQMRGETKDPRIQGNIWLDLYCQIATNSKLVYKSPRTLTTPVEQSGMIRHWDVNGVFSLQSGLCLPPGAHLGIGSGSDNIRVFTVTLRGYYIPSRTIAMAENL